MKQVFIILTFSFLVVSSSAQESNAVISKTNHMETPMVLGLRTTIYKVGDLTKAKAWYAKAFKVEPYFDEPFYVGFNIGGYELGLQPEEVPTTDKTDSSVAYWGVEKIQEVYDHMIAIGASDNEKPYNVGGDLMTATLKDPWGNFIGLIYNPYFKLKGE